MLQAWIEQLEFSSQQRCFKANWPRAITATQCFVNLFLSSVLFLQGWIVSFFLCYLLAFPYNIKMPPLSLLSAFIHLCHVHTAKFFWWGGGDKVLFISRMQLMHHRWLDLYFVWKSKMEQKTKRLSSCSDHLVQYCTKKWIKGQKLLSKEKCRSWALALVTLSSFTKQDRKKYLLEPYKHGYLLWNCHSFE